MNSRLAKVSNADLNHLIKLALCAGVLLFTVGEAEAKCTTHSSRSGAHSKPLVTKSVKTTNRNKVASKPITRTDEQFTMECQPTSPGVYQFVFSSGVMTVTDLTTTGSQPASGGI